MNIGIIGSGGREHSLCFKLKESKIVHKIYCFPGNAGTEKIAQNINIETTNFEEIKKECLKKNIELLVVGPEQPLVDGIVEYFNDTKIRIDYFDFKDEKYPQKSKKFISRLSIIDLLFNFGPDSLKYLKNNFYICK